MEANIRTYSKARPINKRPRIHTIWDFVEDKDHENKLDPLKFTRRLGSSDEKLDDDDDDEIDEIISSPMRRRILPSVTRTQKSPSDTKADSSSSCSSLKKDIEISDDDCDVVFTESGNSTKHNSPRTSQSMASPKRNYPLESYSIDTKSFRSLDYGSMLNDTIVQFYMNYLINQAPKVKTERIHLFNSFFFSKFKELYKQLRSGDKKISTSSVEQIVARWDKHVNMFQKDFLVVPICDNYHWYLLIIAFAQNVPADQDEPLVIKESTRDESKSYNEPAILIFDSMSYSYLNSLTLPVREIFLKRRWKIECPNEEPKNFRDMTLMRNVIAKVPKQKNLYDCGVHLLHYFEKFLANPSRVYKKVMASEDLRLDFAVDTSKKRLDIKALIPKTSM